MQIEIVFSQSTATQEVFKVFDAIRVYSHIYWPAIFLTTHSSSVLARERSQIPKVCRKNTLSNSIRKQGEVVNIHLLLSIYLCQPLVNTSSVERTASTTQQGPCSAKIYFIVFKDLTIDYLIRLNPQRLLSEKYKNLHFITSKSNTKMKR